jgi:branched-chain amino acid transport system permease protein
VGENRAQPRPQVQVQPRLHPRPRFLGGVLAVAGAAMAAALPHLVSQSQLYFWETVLVQVLFATSVNLLWGYANLPSFGQAAFFGMGAYTVAEMASRWAVPACLAAAVAAGALAALLLGIAVVRVGGTAFSMVTLAIGQGLYLAAYQTPTFGGENGIPDVLPRGLTPGAYWLVLVAGVALGMAFLYRVVHSPFGLTLMGIRDDPKRAQFLGIPVYRRRLLAFVFAGATGALAGGLMAYASGIVTPDSLYWTQSGYPVVMAVVGGIHTFWGPALGALVVTWILQQLSQVTPAYLLPLGAVLLAVLMAAPRGLMGLGERWVERRWGHGGSARPGGHHVPVPGQRSPGRSEP